MRRRVVTIPAVFAAAVLGTALVPIWLPVVALVDLIRLRWRLPLARLGVMGVQWTWAEVAGITMCGWWWVTGRAGDVPRHYALMGWWADHLMRAMRRAGGVRPTIEGGDALATGNAIVVCRHASFADALLSGWATETRFGLSPRYVLKHELLFDPCLDVVGQRIPAHFIDRTATDGEAELASLRQLAATIDEHSVAVIFAEGTRANPAKRARALARIAERDPERAERMGALQHLIPPRPAGTQALLDGAPDADVVFAWHVGFDGLDTFGGMVRVVGRGMRPVRLVLRRVPRAEIPAGDVADWLDREWLRMDAEVAAALAG